MRGFLRTRITAALALAAITAVSASEARAQAAVPSPTVSGPVSGGTRTGQPYNANLFDLTPFGYVEQEFLFSGTATDYVNGNPPAPYTSRIVVRRPVDPARFNGTVLMEWANVTTGFDVEADYANFLREIFRGGYVYVSASIQIVGHTSLKNWDPVRYATLVHPGDDYSHDIASQAGQAVLAPLGVDPLAGLVPEVLILDGDSQSAIRMTPYINDVLPQIQPVFDGYMVQVGGGPFRTDLTEPVFHIQSENEASGTDQPDTAFYRLWEIAGSSHGDKYNLTMTPLTAERDHGLPPGSWPIAPADNATCTVGRFPKYLAVNAALRHMDAWIRHGTGPPTAPQIQMDGSGGLARDANGNTLGGLRLPAIDVPVATYDGEITSCGTLGGETTFFDAATLASLYPTQAAFDSAYEAATAQAVAAGYMLPDDANRQYCGFTLGDDPAVTPIDDCDGDGAPNVADNCHFRSNPLQADDGGIATATPDGIGNACQCGDVSANGQVNGQDANAIRRFGLGATPNPLFLAPQHCDVSGNGSCNGQDAAAVSREALGLTPNPLFGAFRCESQQGPPL